MNRDLGVFETTHDVVARDDLASANSRGRSPNKHMQRAGRHKVLGRGRSVLLLSQVPLARVLTRRRAGADVNR